MSWVQAVGRRAAKIFGGGTKVARTGAEAAGRMNKDVSLVSGVDGEVKGLIAKAEEAFSKKRFAGAIVSYRDALGAHETAADAKAVLQSVSSGLEGYASTFHLWNKAEKVAAKFAAVKGDAEKVVAFGDAASIIGKSEAALAQGDRKLFEELYSYGKDLMTRIWFPFYHNLSPAKRSAMTRKVEESSWKLAEFYAAKGHGDKAAAFVNSATAPTISRPSFARALREVQMYDKHGAIKDVTAAQASDLALEARNLFRFGGGKIEDTQNALFEMLKLSLKLDSKALPSGSIVAWLLNHARTPEEVGSLIKRAESLGYRSNLKRDILGAIKTPSLGGMTIDGTSGAVQAVNPTALVTFAEQHGFGAEATSTLIMAIHGQPRGRYPSTQQVTLGGLVADALNLGR